MTKNYPCHKGSALLVVLGMLSFMLFSGLAFSVYMRQSRLPTSFMRRTVTTRQLAKAALAEAIEEIDQALKNDPHPGVRDPGRTYNSSEKDNFWSHRVFVGKGGDLNDLDPNAGIMANGNVHYPALADRASTVPTLTLEGLAYLPPNLINEARYYSRRTPTAKWKSFWFDSGRYAYTAIDVSDYFDVNRVYANKPRSSGHRVSLAHLFEENGGEVLHSGVGSGAKEWDDEFMDQFRVVDGKMPLVSLADFNIAWGEYGEMDFGGDKCKSPFFSFVKDSNIAYPGGETSAVLEKYRNMTFVTDGWFPTTTGNTTPNTNREKRDLAAYQPFRDADLNGSSMPSMVDKIMGYSSDIVNSGGKGADLMQHLCGLGLVQLWDYLDANRVPVSLAVPTLERVPMIVGLEMDVLPTIKFTTTPTETYENETATSRTAIRKYECVMTMDGSLGAQVLAAYPFREHGIKDSENFDIDGRVAVFFTLDGQQMTLRPGDANASLHLKKTDAESGNNVTPPQNSVFSFALQKQQVSASSIAKNDGKPVLKVGLRGSVDGIGEVKFYQVTYKWPQTKDEDSGAWTPQNPDSSVAPDEQGTSVSFHALAANGSSASVFSDAAQFRQNIVNGIKIKANAAIWARVKYNDSDMGNKTVDLVPACVMDDDELNGANNNDSRAIMIGGDAYPLMRFDATMQGQPDVTVAATGLSGDYPLAIAAPRIICNDPRYNHQPENWYTLAGTGLQEQDWIDETAKMLGQGAAGNVCDNDFYMFTSDQGYMQSVYELAFLPRLTGLTYETKNNGWWGSYPTTLPSRNTFATQASEAKDYNVMWRTYRCFDSNGNAADPFEEIGLTCGENGQKVDPYSDTKAVLLAALANTPHDWRVSSTNKNYAVVSDSEMKDAATFNKKYAWNDYSSDNDGKMCWDCLEAVAEEFKEKVRKAGNWEDGFANLVWSKESNKLLDFEEITPEEEETDSPMYGVDKKFLYGFWHDSFAARQQLFLIFVRAEPMMMGGGVTGQTPPQLGAHAVALVWRDPTPTGESTNPSPYYPHRTRILFYHQFD